jgi:multicomponent Na+:H+ antiporter subunit G
MAVLLWVSIILLVCGIFFSCMGTLGIWVFPDAYSCLHATGKNTTLGVALPILAACLAPDTLLSLRLAGAAVIVLLYYNSAIGTHMLIRGCYYSNEKLAESVIDELAPHKNAHAQ